MISSPPNPNFRPQPEKPLVKLKPNPWCFILRNNPWQSAKLVASLFLIFPAFKIVLDWYRLQKTYYWFTNQRIKIESGVFDLTADEIWLFRVIDMQIKRPFFYRFFDLSDIYIYSTDKKNQSVIIQGINQADANKLFDVLQQCISIERNRHRPDIPGSWMSY